MLRYALSMATDKAAITGFLRAGQKPARGMVAPLPGYPSVQMLPVTVAGRTLDAMSFDPPAARELLRGEGLANLELSLIAVVRPKSKEIAEIVQKQWHEHLGIRLKVIFRRRRSGSRPSFRSSTHKSSRIPGPCSSTIPMIFWCR